MYSLKYLITLDKVIFSSALVNSLLAGLCKKYSTSFHRIWWKGGICVTRKTIWWRQKRILCALFGDGNKTPVNTF